MGEMNGIRLKELVKKLRISVVITILAAAAFAFSAFYPRGHEEFSQHMGPDGPGIIEYHMAYSPFEEFLVSAAPWCFVVLGVALMCTVVLWVKVRRAKKG